MLENQNYFNEFLYDGKVALFLSVSVHVLFFFEVTSSVRTAIIQIKPKKRNLILIDTNT